MSSSDSEQSKSDGSDLKPVHTGNSALTTAGIIIADVVGAGILSMANAMAHFGWALGTVLLLVLLAMNVHISMMMWRACIVYPEARTYTGLVKAAFSTSSRRQRGIMKVVTGFSQYAFIFSVLGLYVLSFGKGIGMVFNTTHVCLPYWALLGCSIILPFCLTARTMGTWKSLLWLNLATILGSIIIPLTDMATRGVEETRPPGSHYSAVAPDLNFGGALSGLSTFTFAFTSQFMLVEIVSEMKDPTELPKAYIGISSPFQVVAFIIVGMGGYYFVGDAVQGMIVDNIPFSSAFRLASACLLVHMLIVYQIKGIVLGRALHLKLHPQSADEDSALAWGIWAGLVLAIAGGAYVFSQVVPFFEDFVDLLGASLTPFNCFVLPIVTYLRSLKQPSGAIETNDLGTNGQEAEENSKTDSDGTSSDAVQKPKAAPRPPGGVLEWVVIALELLLAFVLMVFGTRTAIINISKNWGTYGFPFDCHCEGIWSTCACSGHHAGMESCPAALPGAAPP